MIARLRLTLVDVVLWVLLVVLFFLPVTRLGGCRCEPPGLLAVSLGVAYTVTVLTRKAWPLFSAVAATVLYLTWVSAGYVSHELQALPAFVVIYSLGASAIPMLARALGAVIMVGTFGVSSMVFFDTEALEVGFLLLLFAAAWWLGVTVAARRAYAVELESKTAQLEAAREELAEQAVAEERAGIARELHDVVAHAMSVITVQAGVGAHVMSEHPDQAAVSLGIIERTGREALGELRRMLNVLRLEEEPAAAKPQPGISQLRDLIERSRKAGIPASLAFEGSGSRLPASLDLSIYRIVQESLTNAAKHAPGSRADVTIRYENSAVEVEVLNVGGRRSASEDTVMAGHGLRGMVERVGLFDGSFEAGPTTDGFRVWARFPLEAT